VQTKQLFEAFSYRVISQNNVLKTLLVAKVSYMDNV